MHGLPKRPQRYITALKLIRPYSEAVPCICDRMRQYEEGIAPFVLLAPVNWKNGSSVFPRVYDIPHQDEVGQHPSEKRQFINVLSLLPRLKSLYLEEDPSIITPVT